MRRDDASASKATKEPLDPDLDAGNEEFDFSNASRPGRNELFERAQGHLYEVTDEEDPARRDGVTAANVTIILKISDAQLRAGTEHVRPMKVSGG
jgi:hypothetical protein